MAEQHDSATVEGDGAKPARVFAPARGVAAVAIGALLVAACGDGGRAGDDPVAADPQTVAAELGCGQFEEKKTAEPDVRELYACDEETNLYFFDTTADRDSWRESAEASGTVVVEEGATWLRTEQ